MLHNVEEMLQNVEGESGKLIYHQNTIREHNVRI